MRGRLMKIGGTLTVVCVACLASGPAGGCDADVAAGRPQPTTRPAGVAVVELFTSQGCSSCPPAEAVLADVGRAADRDGRPVYPLAFHVDYWNHLGWADPFSDAAFTRRQYGYGQAFHLESVYTPQMVVNGRVEFNGSDADAADRAIRAALAVPVTVRVAVAADKADGGGYRVACTADGAPAGTLLNVAVVERGLSTDVPRGENAGHRLDQPAVVRWFTTVPLDGAARAAVAVPPLPAIGAGRGWVVAFAQRPQDRAVIGADAVPLP